MGEYMGCVPGLACWNGCTWICFGTYSGLNGVKVRSQSPADGPCGPKSQVVCSLRRHSYQGVHALRPVRLSLLPATLPCLMRQGEACCLETDFCLMTKRT